MPLIFRVISVLVPLVAPAVAWAQCVGAPVTAARFAQDLDTVEATVKKGELDALDMNMAELSLAVPCLSEVVATKDAARLHLLSAIQADPLGTNSSTPAVRAPLARYKELLPDQPFPPDLLPEKHGVRAAFGEVDGSPGPTTRVPVPRSGHVLFDGITTRDRPSDRPALFQLAGDSGQVLASANLLPGDPLPRYDVVPRVRNHLWMTAGACALASAGTFAGAWVARSHFDRLDSSYTSASLKHDATTTNALVLVSATFGAAAVGLGTAGFAVGER